MATHIFIKILLISEEITISLQQNEKEQLLQIHYRYVLYEHKTT